jgi:hypothetical protein
MRPKHWIYTIPLRLRSLFRWAQADQELDDELRDHLERKTEEYVAKGLTQEEAHRRAPLDLGGIEQTKEKCRDARHVNWIQGLVQDLRFGLLMLRKSLGFTAVAILTLALGIGANTAIFSCINAWIIKPLPYPQSDRLMVFATHDKKNGWTGGHVTSPADFFDFQRQNTSFEQIVAWAGAGLNLTGDGHPELVDGGRVTWNFFDALGAKPILGRTFVPDDDRSGAAHVVILGEGLWQGRYVGDPKIIGRNINVGGEAYTVIGVMPGTFQFPLMGIANLWTPLALTDKQRADRSGSWLPAFGRLKPGVTQEQAEAEAGVFFSGLEKQFPQTNANLTWPGFAAATPDYFSTMQIGLVKGRLFNSADSQGSSPVVIITQSFAREFWPNEDPIGRQIRFGEQHTVATIVGVVGDIMRDHLRERGGWLMFVPLAQFPSSTLAFVVRSSADPTTMATAIRDAIWSVDNDQPISSAPLETLIAVVDAGYRVMTKLMVFFGALAMFLGTIGIYGVMAHLVSQRIHEIGIRMALGASPVQVLRMVIGSGLKLAVAGVAVGIVLALGATRSLTTLLYQVAPDDPLTFIAVPILFVAVAVAASYLPACRAMAVDPMVALRYE